METLDESCGTCVYLHAEDGGWCCHRVHGEIVADYVCRLWEAVDITADPDDDDPAMSPLDMDSLGAASSSSSSVYMAKSDGFTIAKLDEDERTVFGWASVAADAGGDLLVDHHSDIIEPAELEKAAYEYVLKFRGAGEMHRGQSVGQLVESLVMTPEKARAMGIRQPMATAWWVGYKIDDPEVFAKIKDGTYSMFSIQGTADTDG